MATFSQLIPENDLWSVLDSSKLMDYELCPRKYFFRHVLGWSPNEGSSIHLEFGSAVHLAMEVLYHEGFSEASLSQAYDAFLSYYRQYFPVEMDEVNSPKNPDNFLRMLVQYKLKYQSEKLTPLHIETAGVVHVSNDLLIHFKMDLIAHADDKGYFSLEHKTSTRYNTLWEAQWRQRIQVGTYNHVLNALYPSDEVFGVIINGLFIHKAPRMKKDGTPYAGEGDNEFHRCPVRMTPDQMEGWRRDVVSLVEEIKISHEVLAETREEEPHLDAFRRNRGSCTQYGICPYLRICEASQNPSRLIHIPPPEMEVSFWDPRKIPTVKEKLEL